MPRPPAPTTTLCLLPQPMFQTELETIPRGGLSGGTGVPLLPPLPKLTPLPPPAVISSFVKVRRSRWAPDCTFTTSGN